MPTLTSCFRKAGEYLHPEDKTAIHERAKDLRRAGLKSDDANRQALAERIQFIAATANGTWPGAVFSEARGVLPHEVMERYPLKVLAEMMRGNTLDQSHTLRSGEETLAKYGLPPGGKYNTRDIAAALEGRQREQWGKIDPTDRSPEAADKIANWMAEEVRFEMQHPRKSGVGWYSAKYQRALDKFGEAFPELQRGNKEGLTLPDGTKLNSKEARGLFTALVAITSDGQKVVPNFRMAADLYKNFRTTGKLSTDRGHQRMDSISGNVQLVQELFDRMGAKAMREYLLQEATVTELRKIAKDSGVEFNTDYQAHIKLPMAAVSFGPKLGAFYANLMGAHGYLTMDRWWSRTFNRYRGTLLQAPTADGLARIKELNGHPEWSDDQAIAATVDPRNSYAAKNFKDGTELEKASNTVYKAAFENLEDAPFNATDRTFMLEAVGKAQQLLEAEGRKISVADIQAVLWYYEKRLYGELGARQTADVSYEEAAHKVTTEHQSDTGEPGRPNSRFDGSAEGEAWPGEVSGRVAAGDTPGLDPFEPGSAANPSGERNTLNQDQPESKNSPRGQIAFGDGITKSPTVISLLKGADLSTFIHESGHFYLEVLNHTAIQEGAASEFGRDFRQVLDWFRDSDHSAALDRIHKAVEAAEADASTPEEKSQAAAMRATYENVLQNGGLEYLKKQVDQSWDAMPSLLRMPYHEMFAEGFEKYLMEGKAPSAELQPMFGRFRSWLISVYKSIKGMNVRLTPEVRGVFDRLLASDEAIKSQERIRSYAPLFENAKAAGMSIDDFNRYIDLGRQATEQSVSEIQARSIQDMKWASNAKNTALRALQRQADAARKEVAAKVENEVSQDPAFAAQDYLREHAPKPDAEALKEWTERRDSAVEKAKAQAKEELYAANPEAKGLQKGQLLAKNKASVDNRAKALVIEWEKANERPEATGGADPEIVASMFGFPSGDAMRRAIMEAGSKKDAIKLLTDQRMLQEHGELTDPQSMEQAANEAVHNETRARFMATGLKALTKTELPANQLAKAAKEVAEGMIAAKRAGDLDPRTFLAAEARAGKEALSAAARDPAKAIEAQRTALLNNRLAKAAMDAKAEIQKGLEYLKKFDKPTVAKAIGADYMDRINELLAQYDVTNRLNTRDAVETRMQFREWLQSEFNVHGVMPEVSDALLDWTQRKHWKELRVEEFRGLVDAVKSIEHVGRAQTEVTINGQRVALQEIVDRAKADMASLPHSEPVDIQPHLLHAAGLNKINAQWLRFKQTIRGIDAALLKMEQVFQWLTYGSRAGLGETRSGPFLEMFQKAANAEGAERAMRAESAKDLRDLHQLLKDANINPNESLDVPLSRKGRGTQWYREELIAAALNTGNDGNLKKLLEGYGWDERRLMDALNTHLSAAEWKFVQGVWDALGKYGDGIVALQRRMTGVTPEMVKPRAVHTKDGQLDGGYYPVVYDSFQDPNIDSKAAKNADMLFENQWAKPATSKGHTIARTGYVGPIQLSLGVIARHIDQVTHDLAWREAIIDMNKFLSHSEITSEVDKTLGREYRKQFRPWLQAMANDKVFNTAGDSAWESFYRKARANTTMVGLGFRMSTMMIHGTSALSNSIGEVGTKWFAKGAAQFATPERWEAAKQFMYERSPEMANRFNEHDRNVNEAVRAINEHQRSLGTISATQKAVDGARKFAFYGVSALDMASAAPTWYAAYLKGMAKVSEGGLDMSETDAVDYANRAVRNAHGGGGVKDLSAVQRSNGAISLATMFYSFWNHMYNRQRDLGKGYANLPDSFKQGTGTKDFAKLLARSWWYFVIPQLIHAALKPDDSKDNDGSLSHMLVHMSEEVGLGFVSGVPILRDLANAYVNGRDYAITPMEQIGKSLVKAAVDTTKFIEGEEPSAHAGKNLAQAAGYVLGLPTGQLSASGSFLWDVYNGDADPQGFKDWYSGIVHGRITE